MGSPDAYNNRATASGDTESRFRYASEDQRRAAIAHLAFEVRQHAGGAGMAITAARDTLRSYLASSSGFELDSVAAAKAAAEILSVNSETQGLVVEKAPGEVGFVHASFEEYLGAEHIGGWPFLEIETFVRLQAGQSRWRNVLANLLGYVQRRDEFDRLVAIIEEPDTDELSQLNKQALLGDIAFEVAVRAATTAKRLALGVMNRVETHDWMPARREALVSVLKGLSDPTLKADVERRVTQWLPARLSWRRSLVEELGNWAPTDKLQDTLFRALHDEDRGIQRSAAAAYARAFSQSPSARQRLVDGLARSRDLHASVAMLESLALGWSDDEQSVALFQEAWALRQGELRLVGAFGLLAQGRGTPEMRDTALSAQGFWSGISYEYRPIAVWMLGRYWPNEPELVKGAIARITGHGNSIWEYDFAGSYLLACETSNADLRQWVLNEFSSEHAFNFHLGNDSIWHQIGRFAAADPEIRLAANAYWQDPEHRIIGMRHLATYVAHAADPEVAAVLRDVLAKNEHRFNRFWAIHAMLKGWGRDHPEVSGAIDALIDAPDEQLDELVSMLPEIYRDKAAARERLLRMSARPNARYDLLTEGMAKCSDSTDEQVVQTILNFPARKGIFDASADIFLSFNKHPSVRALAERSLQQEDPPLTAIAFSYRNDPEFAKSLFDAVVPLSTDLRTQIVEFATGGASGAVLDTILGMAMQECDPELRARMAIAWYGRMHAEDRDNLIQELLRKAVAVGPDYEEVRAAALAGLIAANAVGLLVNMQDRGKPVELCIGNSLHPMPSLNRLICEHFAEIELAFGADLSKRFKRANHQSSLAVILSTAPSASPAAKVAFLALADNGELTLTTQSLHSLAAERPRSKMLLEHCWKILGAQDHNNTTAMVNAEVAEILRSHFPADDEIHQRLVSLYKERCDATSAIALAIYSPQAVELDFSAAKNRCHHFADWAIAVRISAIRDDGESFVALLERMVTRKHPMQFDAQECINRAVHERLQRDSELADLLSTRLRTETDGCISGSFARYLASAGKLDATARTMALNLLQQLAADQRLVVIAYDAVAARWRALRATLLDAVTGGLDLT